MLNLELLKEPIHFSEITQLQGIIFRSSTVALGFSNSRLPKRRKLIRIEAELKLPLLSGELYKEMVRGGGVIFFTTIAFFEAFTGHHPSVSG